MPRKTTKPKAPPFRMSKEERQHLIERRALAERESAELLEASARGRRPMTTRQAYAEAREADAAQAAGAALARQVQAESPAYLRSRLDAMEERCNMLERRTNQQQHASRSDAAYRLARQGVRLLYWLGKAKEEGVSLYSLPNGDEIEAAVLAVQRALASVYDEESEA